MRKATALVLLLACLAYAMGAKPTSMTGLHVDGGVIRNAAEQIVVLRGVNRPGSEYSCVKPGADAAIFDGPTDAASITAMQSWKYNAVRVPLNEDCWTGGHNVPNPDYTGANYRTAIVDFVTRLTNAGFAVILDLHWSSNTTYYANMQQVMPSLEFSPSFWADVATNFMNNSGVIFDLFNEPLPDGNVWDTQDAWNCWKNGGWCNGATFQTAGMQNMLDAIRGVNSTNIVMMGGIQYATSLAEWVNYMPYDPLKNIAAAVHVYDFNFCRSRGCWDLYWAPVRNVVPLIAGETGEVDCGTDFIYDFMNYADSLGIHYTAWAWLVSACSDPSLITDYTGTPTTFGAGLKNNLNALSLSKPLGFSWTFPIWKNGSRTHWVDDWSSTNAAIFQNETKTVRSGTYSLKFIGTPGNSLHWQCWGCINTTVHKSVTFWVNGGGNSNQVYQVRLQQISDWYTIAAGTSNSVDYNYSTTIAGLINGGINAKSWVQATLDLTHLPANTAFDGIRIWSNDTQPAIYMSDVYVNSKYDKSFAIKNVVEWKFLALLMVALCLFM